MRSRWPLHVEAEGASRSALTSSRETKPRTGTSKRFLGIARTRWATARPAGARPALGNEPPAEEVLEEAGERGLGAHDAPPWSWAKRSKRRAVRAMSSGTAVRYQ